MAKILQVCNTDFYLERFLAPLVRSLSDEGHEVECVCEGTRLDGSLLGPRIAIHPFDFPRTSSPFAFFRAIGQMRELIRRGEYHCVDSHNRNASIVARAAAWLENVPVNLYTAHGFYFHDDQSKVAYGSTVVLEAALARITDYTLSQSTEDVRFMTGSGFILPSRIRSIGNGIDTRRFQRTGEARATIERSLSLRSERFRVVTTGRLVTGKGFGDLLDAAALLHRDIGEIELVIIGGNIEQDVSPYQTTFLERAALAGFSDALVVTGITREVERYLATADVFVLPSYREGMPRALLEAMSMELPVVATNIRGCREVVIDQDCGLLFEPHDVTRLSELLRELHGSSSLRSTLGARARRRVLASFDERDYIARQVESIHRLVGRPVVG